MLVNINAKCPHCGQTTILAVSQGDRDGGSFSSTSCRVCRTRFIALTQKDGSVLLLDCETYEAGEESARPLAIISPRTGRSGYRVAPPEYLGILDRGHPLEKPIGISDEDLETKVSSLGRVLYRPDGSSRPPKEVAKRLGWRAFWSAQLGEAVRARLAAPPPLSFPPFIFISYRWGAQKDVAWVAALARDLRTRGYPVLFDREEPGEIDVPIMVSKIADARYFIAVIDPGYVERIGTGEETEPIKDGWVYDECNTAFQLERGRQLRILGLLRSGDQLPSGFRLPFPGTPGNVIDVRSERQLKLVLDDIFPTISGGPDSEMAERARLLLLKSHEFSIADKPHEAFQCAQELTDLLPGIIDGPAQKMRVALRATWTEPGLAAAQEALALAPDSAELHYVTGAFASIAGNPQQAAHYLGLYLEKDDPIENQYLITAHQLLGSSLDDLSQPFAGLAHLRIARNKGGDNSDLLNNLGFVLRRVGQSKAAVGVFQVGLEAEPENRDLLINYAAALVETGNHGAAVNAIGQLEVLYPGTPQVSLLNDVLKELEKQGFWGEPIALLDAPAEALGVVVECSACPAWIPMQEKDMLCARCGAVLSHDCPCQCCGWDGRVIWAPGITAICPYCRAGELRSTPTGGATKLSGQS
ncbi:toll/interleukin-1 receptor domain-containing protein [Rhizobium leguminosarum]|uniref:toll/interleukin-1 receptor domain-containing protein n=1 Tax=Rhizobium leguminosarum TaxID=384 RepID=UPI0013EE4E64|nr:toll/interleukin-1 receptor domain-containing protein [Rhizobium leguminosarum]